MKAANAMCGAILLTAGTLGACMEPSVADVVQPITVEGNRRVESDTIRSYFRAEAANYTDATLDDALKALLGTGLFKDVTVRRVGRQIVVSVIENPVIGRVAFEGNKKIKDEQLAGEIQSKARGAFSHPVVQSDTLRIAEIYRRSGRYDVRVTPEIIERQNDRVDLVFTIEEGAKVGVKSVDFIGNDAFSKARLRDIIKTHEGNLLSFLANNDLYDPDRVEADRDLIRRFYLKHGYADAQVVAALTEYDQDRKGFLVTFKIEEGRQYRVAAVEFRSSIQGIDISVFRPYSRIGIGGVYNAEMVEKSVEDMQIEASRRGYAFAAVRPTGDRNADAATVSIVFNIDEGPRTYVERISIRGNSRTRDYVILREFDISEGDAFNRALVDRAERRLKNLDFFKSAKIVTEPGSSSDRVVLVVDLEEKSTGDFSVSGGYSTSDGALGEVSVSERNLFGRGLYGKVSVSYGQYSRGLSLSVVEPFLLDQRVALGLDLYYKQQSENSYTSYGIKTFGFSPRLGLSLREDVSLQLRYSLYQQTITLSSAYNNCNNNQSNSSLAFNPTPAFVKDALSGADPTNSAGSGYYGYGCYSDGESALPVRKELADGGRWTSMLGYTLNYNTLDNNRNPTEGLLVEMRQDFAGAGGDVTYLKSTVETKFYTPFVAEIVGVLHLQAGILNQVGNSDLRMLDHFKMGANLVRGFGSNGIGPRDITYLNYGATGDALGGTKYWGASFELQMPFWFLPKEVGLKGALYADAGSLWDYQGPTSWSATGEVTSPSCPTCGLQYDDSRVVRTSVGTGLIWASPFGPLRFDFAIPLTKGKYDTVQQFKFGGGTSF